MPTKEEMFPSNYLQVADLEGRPAVLKITKSVVQNLKDFNTGQMKPKTVLSFEGTHKVLVLSAKVNFDGCVKATGCDDSKDWVGHSIEVFPSTTEVGGEMKECIRVRPVTKKKKPQAPPPPKKYEDDRITTGLPKKKSVLPEGPPETDPDDPGPQFGDDDPDYDEAAE
jgi:hypothetical protein